MGLGLGLCMFPMKVIEPTDMLKYRSPENDVEHVFE